MKYKHLTLDERHLIEKQLNNNQSFKSISRLIGKDPSTISKEIRLHLSIKQVGTYGRSFNNCLNRFSCTKYDVCHGICKYRVTKRCSFCELCRLNCEDFVEEVCPSLSKPPYVCNGCDKQMKCTLTKHIYDSIHADKHYHSILVESRSGFMITCEEIDFLNTLLEPLIKEKGQSIHHVYIHHKDEIMLSEKTLYNLIDSGVLKIKNIDLPRKVKFKPRRAKKRDFKVDKQCRLNRTYNDFLTFMKDHPDLSVVQGDTVEGVKGGACLLTLHFTNCALMLAFHRKHNNSRSVIDRIDSLYETLGRETFMKLFPVILLDNGSEFSNPKAIEFDKQHNRRTYVFYCDPSKPYQKPECENNHTLIRRIIPKGKDMSHFNQFDIDLLMSHVNSYSRGSLNDKSPHLLFSTLYGIEVLDSLHLSSIHYDDICFTPKLLSSK